jgi:pimeloyl-ACP methyl ester carboxylesterase
MKLDHDWVQLFFEEAGSGSPPILLIHCWGGDHTYMAPQFEYFRRRHRVVNVDLRGFGQSDKPDLAYTMAGYANELAWMCQRLDLQKPVVVGHSMGGTIALEIGARHPELPSAVVILEALVVAPPPLLDGFRPVLAGIQTPAYAQVMHQMTDQLTGPHFDPRDKARMQQAMASNAQHVMISTLADLLVNDSAAAAARCKAPLLYVSSGPWYTDVERFRSLCPQLVTAQAVGCGHYFQIEVPDQTNAMVDRFIQVSTSRVAAA